jgi:uncharacterized protein YjbJ (UPF0337 family)
MSRGGASDPARLHGRNVHPAAGVFLAVLQQEEPMSSTTDKMKGLANKAAGKVKQGLGQATDDHELEGEGKLQEAKGELQKATGDAKAAIKKAADL